MSTKPTVIVDNGSKITKAGFADTDAYSPKITMHALLSNGIYTRPIIQGTEIHWDHMELYLHTLFHNELKICPDQHTMLFSEPLLNPPDNKAKLTQIMFEKFNIPHFYVAIDALLSIYSTGKITGIVLDSGHQHTRCVPIYQGYCLQQAAQAIPIAGKHITQCLSKMLNISDYNIVSDIRNTLCFVASFDFEEEKLLSTHYELPDGNIIEVSRERIAVTELLFTPILRPQLDNMEYKNILFDGYIRKHFHENLLCNDVTNLLCQFTPALKRDLNGIGKLVVESVMNCCVDIRKDLLRNVVICGGNTMYEGIAERLRRQIRCLLPDSLHWVKVVHDPKRKYAAWIGGCILSRLSTFKEMCIDKPQYEEHGSNIWNRKCV